MIKKINIFIICLLMILNTSIISKASNIKDKNVLMKLDHNVQMNQDYNIEMKLDHNVQMNQDYNIEMKLDHNVQINQDYYIEMKQDILILMLAYPEYIVGVEKNNSDKVYLITKSGKKIIYDDKKQKSAEEKLADPDFQDMLEQDYPLEKNMKIMDKNFDPGRARHYELLNEVYGNSKAGIEKNLIALKYGYTNYQFNSKNRANISLEAALKEVMPLAKTRGDIGSILYPASGTYNYRVISGTGRLSPHSYGIAIDLKSDKKDYWKWSSVAQGKQRLEEYPKELVEAFEKNNFVWGGKWGHFDILHFEYRPEIILKAKYFGNCNGNNSNSNGNSKSNSDINSDYNSNSDINHDCKSDIENKNDSNWHDGVPLEEESVKKYIEIIDNTL